MKSSGTKHREQEWQKAIDTFKIELEKDPFLTQKRFIEDIIPSAYPSLIWVGSKNLSKWINKIYSNTTEDAETAQEHKKRRQFWSEEEKVLFYMEWSEGRDDSASMNQDISEEDDFDYGVFSQFCKQKNINEQTARHWVTNPRIKTPAAILTMQSPPSKPEFNLHIYPDRQ